MPGSLENQTEETQQKRCLSQGLDIIALAAVPPLTPEIFCI